MNDAAKENNLAWLEISLRVILGGIFIWAGIAKLLDLDSFVESVSHFEIQPFSSEPWDMWLGYTLPAFELIVGACLILGILYKGAIISSTMLSAVFLVAIYSVHTRGLNIECGCLGKSLSFGNYYTHITILALMVLAGATLALTEMMRSSKRKQNITTHS